MKYLYLILKSWDFNGLRTYEKKNQISISRLVLILDLIIKF